MSEQTPTDHGDLGRSPEPPPAMNETVTGERVVLGTVVPSQVTVSVAPTQVRRPWRATIRTVFQGAIALATLLPFVASGIYEDGENVPAAVVQVLAVSAAITRVMALPQVEAFLSRFIPFLAATPKEK